MSKQQSSKSAKLVPVSDSPAPYRHAPRTKDGAIDWMAVDVVRYSRYRQRRWRMVCGNCSHDIYGHVGGLCSSCKHECNLSLKHVDLNALEAIANAPISEGESA